MAPIERNEWTIWTCGECGAVRNSEPECETCHAALAPTRMVPVVRVSIAADRIAALSTGAGLDPDVTGPQDAAYARGYRAAVANALATFRR